MSIEAVSLWRFLRPSTRLLVASYLGSDYLGEQVTNRISEMREVAQRFVVEVQKARGEWAAQMVRRALALQG